MVPQSSQTTTLETGNKISDNNYSAGQVKILPSDCCFKENGIFAVVPNELLSDGNASGFLPRERHLGRKKAVEKVQIDDNITVVCEEGESHPIVALLRKSLEIDNANIATAVEGKRMFVVAAKKGKALFANCFAINSEEDMLYYLLAVCEHLGFEPSKTPMATESRVPELVKRYFEVR